ncbi:hypothetical protein SAMN02745146_1121 [Hymenobacter daecheongensis DSM 21074]|uniref:Uncharacterized protein n=1 Tax=Hymenobacter daecheongensis DSM 21074 TaxID=1121955 RepID=A0A1M6CDS9_9BACT|nr:DUF6702 family protein [Hymenobacter daecheongensis]SHI59172.1 hypothetical protein SAMN02745146_1121 [Hymenobacter daecheongensis DSM 21074]
MRRLILLLLLLAAGLAAAAHTYHASIMEVRYNAPKQQLEVALKVFTDDFEKALSVDQPKPISLTETPKAQVTPLLTALLSRSISFGTKPGEALPIRLIGFQKESDAHWVYFSVKLAKPIKGIYLRHRLLLDIFPDEMNIVNVEANGRKQSALFRDGEESQRLQW